MCFFVKSGENRFISRQWWRLVYLPASTVSPNPIPFHMKIKFRLLALSLTPARSTLYSEHFLIMMLQKSPITSPRRRSQRTRKPSNAQTTVNERNGTCAENPSKLLFWHEIPWWQQDNEFILSGYRSVSLVSSI